MHGSSDSLILAWKVAAAEARAAAHATIRPGHLLIALCKLCDLSSRSAEPVIQERLREIEPEVGELRQVFTRAGVEVKTFRRRLRAVLGRGGEQPSGETMHRSPEARACFRRAAEICSAQGAPQTQVLHLLYAICHAREQPWARLFDELGLAPTALLVAVTAALSQPDSGGMPAAMEAPDPALANPPLGTSFLEQLGRDLTRLAREGRLPPVIGRQPELHRLGHILLQHQRSNAILVGEAGVGKTCLVEGLAQRMAAAGASPEFRAKRLIEVSASSLVAGTRHRGDFEERVRGLLAEASRDPNVILFIDEIHALVGAGAVGDNAMDAAALMKPALARGEIHCIGATTVREYRRYIEHDEALRRRFQVVWVEEPTREEAVEVLQGLRPSLQEHHGLSIGDDAVLAAVELSIRYAADLRLPDKALDLLDEACARARLQTFRAVTTVTRVGRAEIAVVVAERYRVPLESLTQDEAARLLAMGETLAQRVKGQEQAIAAVAEVLGAARAGLRRPDRPCGVFLFVGPTGTGKTELAKALAEFLFGSDDRLVRVDMSEYAERHTVSKLIGAPPGYIGHDEEGQLTAAVRSHPYSVVLLDEIEKAHPEVHRLFLQVFDEGRLTDSHGRHASFTEAIIIMTSNLGSSHGGERGPVGFQPAAPAEKASAEARQARIMEAVRAALPPEFLNRIQRVVFFQPLRPEAVRQVIDKVLAKVRAQLSARTISLELDATAYEVLMAEGFDQVYGARAMERTIDRLLVAPLSRLLLQGQLKDSARVYVGGEGGSLQFHYG